MSASREKKMRQNKTNYQTNASSSKKNGKVWKTVLAVVLVVAILAATVFFSLLNNGSLNSKLTAMTVNDHKISASTLNYFYLEARQKMADDFGELYSMMVSTDIPLSQQPFINDTFDSWGDYVLNTAMNSAVEMYSLCDHAAENGFKLSEDGETDIQTERDAVEYIAKMYGYANADAYLAGTYGTGSTLENYLEYYRLRVTAGEYIAQKMESMVYTQDEIDAYYAENAEDYDSVSFQMFAITTDMMEETDEAAAKAACEAAAKEMADSVTSIEQFNELCKAYVEEDRHQYYDKGAITYFRDYTAAETDELYRDWLFDEAREAGNTTYVPFETEEEAGCYVLHFVEKTDLNYNVVSFHQIVVDVTSTDEDILAVGKEEAQAILDEYLNGEEQTEEAFLAVMNKHSGESTYTGTYQNTSHGAMISEYDSWLFNENRQPGETTVIQSELGYHVIYFTGIGETFYNYSVSEDIRSEEYTEWMSNIVSNAETKTYSFATGLLNLF